MIRTFDQATVEEIADAAGAPVINALTDEHHPCQALADVLTLRERFGDLNGLKLAFVGDFDNVATSLAEAAVLCGIEFVVGCPAGYERAVAGGGRRPGPGGGGSRAPTRSTRTSSSPWATRPRRRSGCATWRPTR